jgi:GT2 family glycosyltransferase
MTDDSAAAPRPKLSVVIPCLDVADTLAAQLTALAAQEVDAAWEVVIADNGSTDGTRELALSFADRLPAIRVVDAPRRGRHHACDVGAEAACGGQIVFVDGDDEVAPGFLQAMSDALDDHAVVAGRLEHRRFHDGRPATYGAVQVDGLRDDLGFLPAASGGCLGVRRAAFEAVGGFGDGPAYGEDVDLSWRLALAGYPIHFAPGAAVHYRQRDDLRSMYRQHRNFGAAHARLFRLYRRHGMPRRRLASSAADWWRIVRGAVAARTPDEKARWVRRLGRAIGRLRGSLECRVLYL